MNLSIPEVNSTFSTHIQRKRIATGKFYYFKAVVGDFSTHIQRKRIATGSALFCCVELLTFQPISSESGLRPSKQTNRVPKIFTFQPISSESGLRQSSSKFPTFSACGFSTHIQRKRIATSYPVKWWTRQGYFSTHIQRKRIATEFYMPAPLLMQAFQPISSESGLRLLQPMRLARSWSCFSTHIQRKRIATLSAFGSLCLPSVFSTHIQRKRIATLLRYEWYICWNLFNPYPAKADCDLTWYRHEMG